MKKNKILILCVTLVLTLCVSIPFATKKVQASLNYNTQYYSLLDSVSKIEVNCKYIYNDVVYYKELILKPQNVTETQDLTIDYLTVNGEYIYTYNLEIYDEIDYTSIYIPIFRLYYTAVSDNLNIYRVKCELFMDNINSIHIYMNNLLGVDNIAIFDSLQLNVSPSLSIDINYNDNIITRNNFDSFKYVKFSELFLSSDYNLYTYDYNYKGFKSFDFIINNIGGDASIYRLDFYQTSSLFNLGTPITLVQYNEFVYNAYYGEGFNNGYDSGYVDTNPLSIIFNGVTSFLNIEIFPNFYVYSLLLIAFGFSLFGVFVKYALGG